MVDVQQCGCGEEAVGVDSCVRRGREEGKEGRKRSVKTLVGLRVTLASLKTGERGGREPLHVTAWWSNAPASQDTPCITPAVNINSNTICWRSRAASCPANGGAERHKEQRALRPGGPFWSDAVAYTAGGGVEEGGKQEKRLFPWCRSYEAPGPAVLEVWPVSITNGVSLSRLLGTLLETTAATLNLHSQIFFLSPVLV